MDTVQNSKRIYRKGLTYRKGNVVEKDIVDTFGFKSVIFSSGVVDGVSSNIYNLLYDGLYDLSLIFGLDPRSLSLPILNKEPPSIFIGSSLLGSLCVTSSGMLLRNWLTFFLYRLGVVDIFSSPSSGSDVISSSLISASSLSSPSPLVLQSLFDLVSSLKTKDLSFDSFSVLKSDTLNNLYSLLEQMPLKLGTSDEIAEIEDSREKFLRVPSYSNMCLMFDIFEKNNLSISSLRQPITDCVTFLSTYSDVTSSSLPSVPTSYFLEYSDLTFFELLYKVLEVYADLSLKEHQGYNNFLIPRLDSKSVKDDSELSSFILLVRNFFFIFKDKFAIPPILSDSVSSEVVSGCVSDSVIIETPATPLLSVVDSSIKRDLGKFKLTLFKKLTSEIGLTVKKTEKTLDSYCLHFNSKYLKRLSVKLYNNPSLCGHSIILYCGASGSIEDSYTWDNLLDYPSLVKSLSSLDLNGSLSINSPFIPLSFVKFKFTTFIDLCTRAKLNISMSTAPKTLSDYKISFSNMYLKYILVPLKYDPSKSNMLKIKTLREEIYHTWVGILDYDALINKLLVIDYSGNTELKKERDLVVLSKHKLDCASVSSKSSSLVELSSCSCIHSTKDLREHFQKYLKLKYVSKITPDLNFLVSNLEKLNLFVDFCVIPKRDLQGNSEVWHLVSSNSLQILSRADPKKQLEGLIEGFVEFGMLVNSISGSKKSMLSDGVIYLLCSLFDLDVRTYCISPSFHSLIQNPVDLRKYYSKCIHIFDGLSSLLLGLS